jgi:hypothetical protein
VLKARLPVETGALVLKALDAAIEHVPLPDVSAETYPAPEPSWTQRRADALGTLAESFLVHGAAAQSSGDRQQVVVHVDANTLEERTAGRCEFEDGPAIMVLVQQAEMAGTFPRKRLELPESPGWRSLALRSSKGIAGRGRPLPAPFGRFPQFMMGASARWIRCIWAVVVNSVSSRPKWRC